MSLDASDPYQWRAIGYDQICGIQNVSEGPISTGFRDTVHSRNGNKTRTSLTVVNPAT
jgi:hypothetical protein